MTEKRRLVSFSEFKATMSYESLTGMFETDAVHQIIRFVPSNGMDPVYLHYSDIMAEDTVIRDADAPADENAAADEKKHDKDADKREKPYFAEFYLYIMLSDPERPNVRIPFIFQKTLRDSVLGKRAVEDSYVIKRWVRAAMKEPIIETAYAAEDEEKKQELMRRERSSWICPKCNYINQGIRSICMSCGISRSEAIVAEGGKADLNSGRPLIRFIYFEPTRSCETLTGLFEIDAVHQLVRFTPNNTSAPQMCHYRDIADVEVIQKNQTVSHENDDHDFDRPDDIYLVEFYLYVMLSTENRESLRIPFIFQKTLKESVLGRRAIQDSNTIKRWLRDAMHEPDRETAFADDAEIDELVAAEKDPNSWDCPRCGYRNKSSRVLCYSCNYRSAKR